MYDYTLKSSHSGIKLPRYLYGPQREKMSLQTKILISEKQVLFERVMFPKYNSFYLTGLLKKLCEIWRVYYMYPFNVIAKKNGAKARIVFLHVNVAQKTLHLVEKA